MAVPLLELAPAYRELADEFDRAYRRVMESGRFLLGPELEAFEREFADFVGTRHCVGTANGLEALQLVLMAVGLRPGDEVVVPSNGYIAAWLAVTHAGGRPVPCEPDERTFNLSPDRVASSLTNRTRAILPIHLYGHPAEAGPLMELAESRGLFLLEDAAQAHGARSDGKSCGALGHAGAFSFYPSKNLGAFADAGAITLNDAALAERLRSLRNYGARKRYFHDEAGLNSRLDELQAAFLRVRLSRLGEWNERRRRLAARYQKALAGVGDLRLPAVADGAEPVWHLYVVRTGRREELRRHLAAAGIGTEIHYPVPPHLSGAYRRLGWKRGDFPVAEKMAEEVLSLPIGPHLRLDQADEVCEAIARFFK